MQRYLLALIGGGVLAMGLLAAVVGFLAFRGTLAPPQISNSLCLDEKLAFMRKSPPKDTNLLVVGSSVAWRHFNSPEAVRLNSNTRPYNAGLCGTNVAQTEAVMGWLLARVPSTKRVLLIASPVDFTDCSPDARSAFDVRVADRYVFEREGAYRFYLRYFALGTLFRNSIGLRRKRADMSSFGSLVMNDYGDAPIEPEQPRELLYGAPTFDPGCYAALRRTAAGMARRGVPFDVALTPLHPAWHRQYDPQGKIIDTWWTRVGQALAATGARLIEPDRNYPEAAFFDAIHLRWSRTPQFTRSIIAPDDPFPVEKHQAKRPANDGSQRSKL